MIANKIIIFFVLLTYLNTNSSMNNSEASITIQDVKIEKNGLLIEYEFFNDLDEAIIVYLDIFARDNINDVAEILNQRNFSHINTFAVISEDKFDKTIKEFTPLGERGDSIYCSVFPIKFKILKPDTSFRFSLFIDNFDIKRGKYVFCVKVKYGKEKEINELIKDFGEIDLKASLECKFSANENTIALQNRNFEKMRQLNIDESCNSIDKEIKVIKLNKYFTHSVYLFKKCDKIVK